MEGDTGGILSNFADHSASLRAVIGVPFILEGILIFLILDGPLIFGEGGENKKNKHLPVMELSLLVVMKCFPLALYVCIW